MTKEQYNSLSSFQKEVYDKCNRGNKGALFAAWGIAAILFVILFIKGISIGDPLGGIGVGLAIGVLVGGLLPGIAHLGFLFKKIGLGNTILLWILLGIFILMLYAIILMVIWYAGSICFIVDTILFIMKKPLIYRWEDKRILAKAAAAAPVYQGAPSASEQLNELNQMLNSGTIKQEEFEAKKAEIMARM